MSPEPREAVTPTAAHWGSLEENGRMTSMASQSMAAPGPPEAWDTGKCKWGKSIDGETSFFSPAAHPYRKGLQSRLRHVWTENLGHSARLQVNMWHRSPATCENDLAVCPPAGFQTSIQPHAVAMMDCRRQRVHCRHLTVLAAKNHPSLTDHLAGYSLKGFFQRVMRHWTFSIKTIKTTASLIPWMV